MKPRGSLEAVVDGSADFLCERVESYLPGQSGNIGVPFCAGDAILQHIVGGIDPR